MAAHVWLEYCLPAQAGSTTLVAYTLTAASGRPENDPVHVVLHGVRMRCELGGNVFGVLRCMLSMVQTHLQDAEHACLSLLHCEQV